MVNLIKLDEGKNENSGPAFSYFWAWAKGLVHPEAGLETMDPGLMTGDSAGPFPGNGPPLAQSGAPELLDQRLRRLEDVVAELQDTEKLEERILECLTQRMTRLPKDTSFQGATAMVVEAGRRLLPAAAAVLSPGAGRGPRPPVVSMSRPTWLVAEVYSEFKDMVCMFFDPRYRVSRPVAPATHRGPHPHGDIGVACQQHLAGWPAP